MNVGRTGARVDGGIDPQAHGRMGPQYFRRESCRGCDGALNDFLSLGQQPLANRLRKADESPVVPRYPLTLCRCTECELVQLREVVDPALLFADYAYVPSTSSTMHAHFDALAAEAIDTLKLGADDLVVDIGSNDGLLLSSFKKHGVRVLGVEPAENLARRASESGIPTVCTFFSTEAARRIAQAGHASLVCATNVFAHVDDIRGFMRAAFDVLTPDGIFLVEVQSFADTVASLAFDMTYHEHLTYYATSPLARMCDREGLELLDVDRVATHGGSLRAIIGRKGHALARPDRVAARIVAERPFTGEAASRRFAHGAERIRRDLHPLLQAIQASGGYVAAYGAPAKATVLLNYCDLSAAQIAYVVDKNRDKQGAFIPGVDIPVVGPERIAVDPPSHMLLLAWNLTDEIVGEQAGFRAAGGRFILPVPTPRVLDETGPSTARI
ncbi:MAG: methyltransferase domain-containing protein [Gemmatimonadaceae bacterium]